MPYIPASAARFGTVDSTQGMALVTPISQYSELFFVTGGSDSTAVFLSEGIRGRAMRTETAVNFDGMIVEDIKIEVDTDSAFNPGETGKTLLAIIRQGSATGLFVSSDGGGFRQTVIAPIGGVFDPGVATERVAFTRWRIVLGEGDDKVTLLEIDAAPELSERLE
ncbi:hypothetical protein [Sphingomonas koreensis]